MSSVRFLLVALLCSTAAFAGDLKISVQSPSGDRVAGVQVSIFRADNDSGVGVQTTAGDGTATFANLPDGQYRAVVLAPGFAEQSLTFSIPQTQSLTAELKLATTPQTVVVSATATPAPAEQTGTSVSLLNSDQLTLLNPVASSDALQYIPGAIVESTGRRGNLATLFVRGGESNYNKVLIDGVPVNTPGGVFDFGVVPMNNVERLEVERGPESTVYGSDAMTSVVQLWTATGSTHTPLVQFGADGGNFSTANGYASVAGARGIFDYNLFADQFNTQGQGVNDAYSNSLQGGNIGIRISDRVAFRLRARHYNSWTGVQGAWWYNGNPVLPPDPNQYAHQNNFLASGALTVSGPGAWQHEFSGFEYNHVALNVNPVDDPDRQFDTAFNSLSKYNRAGFAYQGDVHATSLGRDHAGLHLRGRERLHQQRLRVQHQHHPWPALQQLSFRAGDGHLEAALGSGRPRLRQQLEFWQQGHSADLGQCPACCAGTRYSVGRACTPPTPRASRSPASSRRSASPEPTPRCPIPTFSRSRTALSRRASSRDSSATGCRSAPCITTISFATRSSTNTTRSPALVNM